MKPDAPIMIIGSDASFCYLMQRYVTQSHHAVCMAYLGEDIVAMILRESPIAILLEADPPANRSLALLETLSGHAGTCDIPVVLCAWQEQEKTESHFGADGYLPKPILYKDFVEALMHIGVVARP
jgi:response regulator of citrate/malate metabolism